MRVTNGMIRNTSLNGLYTHMNAINKTYAQMSTGKKIQTVSDDPIIAGRALKLRTSVLEMTQHESNAKEATSWMEVTEAALENMTEILKTVRTKCVQAANGTLANEDRLAIKTDIAQLINQLYQEANATYGGRYVFSGYKTDEPLILAEDYLIPTGGYTVKEDLILGSDSSMQDGTKLKEDSVVAKGSVLGAGTTINAGSEIGAGTILSVQDAQNVLGITIDPSPDKYTFDSDKTIKSSTILTKAELDELGQAGVTVQATEILDDNGQGTGKYQLDADATVTKGTVLKNELSDKLFDLKNSGDGTYTLTVDCNCTGYTLTGEAKIGSSTILKGETQLQGGTVLAGSSVLKKDSQLLEGSKLGKGTINPKIEGEIDGHAIEYEIGVNSTIDVNVQGMDHIFKTIIEQMNEVYTMVDDSLSDESISSEDLHRMLTNKLDEIDSSMKSISEATSDLGSRMARVVYVETRLVDQKTSFKNLLSNTEDIDIEEVYTRFNIEYTAYQSALQATSKILTNTLADYL